MPFRSEKQRRYLWANEPDVARRWTNKYGSKPKKKKSSLLSAYESGRKKLARR